MKIVYGAGNISGSNLRLNHFLRHTNEDIKIAAYYNNHEYLNEIHWVLDALQTKSLKESSKIKELLGTGINVNVKNFNIILDDIVLFNPDLIISDYEPIIALIAQSLSIPLISCSPIHLLDGIQPINFYKQQFVKEYEKLKAFNYSYKKLIYSGFYLLNNAPHLLQGFKWITPYPETTIINPRNTNDLNKILNVKGFSFNTGNSQNIFSQILLQKNICIADSPIDLEAVINGIFIESLGIGVTVGESENNLLFLNKKLEKLFSLENKIEINNTTKFLHEEIYT